MDKSKLSILLLFLVMILAMSAVSAADESADSTLSNVIDESASLNADDIDDEVLKAPGDVEVLTDSGNNFTSLQNEINEDGVSQITLTKDYVRVDGDNDILINKDFTIDGQNTYIIDANNLGGIFKVNSGYTLTLMGVTLINGNAENGGAIYNNGGTLAISDSYFINNTATKSGGAIYNDGGSADIIGSTFDGNNLIQRTKNGWGGAAIYDNGGTILMYMCTVTNNIKDIKHRGGTKTAYKGDLCSAAVTSSGNLTVSNSYFANNSGCYGGAILSNENGILTVSGSLFENNFAFNGGAINFAGKRYTITTSNFTGNSARGTGSSQTNVAFGGAICSQETGDDCIISDCRFEDNTAVYGGAVSADNSKISDCTFINNTADAKYAEKFNGKSNTNGFSYGDAIYSESSVEITDSNFIDNNGQFNTGVYVLDAEIAGSSFKNTPIYVDVEGSLDISDNQYDNEGSDITGWNADIYFDGAGDAPSYDGTPYIHTTITGFAQLQSMIDALPATGGRLILSGDVSKLDSEYDSFANGVIISKSANIYADGYTITSNSGKVFTVNDGATLTLRDANVVGDGNSAIVNNGKLSLYVSAPSSFSNVSEYAIENHGTVTQAGITTFTQLNNLIALVNGGEINIGSSKITKTDDEKATFADGIVVESNLTITGYANSKGVISTYLDANNSGRIFSVNDGVTLTLNKIILKNGNAENGGAVYVEANNKLVANNVDFVDNVAADNGGAIYTDGGEISLNNCILDGNDVTNLESSFFDRKGGAAIYAKNSNVTLVETNVTNNGRSELDRSKGDMINAVINLINSNAIISYGLFENNTGIYGGAIYAEGDGTQTLSVIGAAFNNNKAYNGGAIDISDMITTINDCNFTDNWVVGPGSSGYYGYGGAVAVDGNGSLEISDSNFTGNRATGPGASAGAVGIANANPNYENFTALIDNCVFEKNTAVSFGGAISDICYNSTISNCHFTDDNEAETGNAIYNGKSLTLSGNTIDGNDAGIYTTKTIDTHVWVVVNDGQDVTVEYYDTIPIVVKITDDNGNLIRINETTLDIDLGDRWTRYALTLDEATGFYTMDSYLVDDKSGKLTPSRTTLQRYFPTYDANTNLNSSYITMIKANSTLEVTYQNVSLSDDVVITINLTGKEGAPAISLYTSANPPFKVTVNDVVYKVKITKGIGTLTIPDLPAGDYVINASWGGNTRYNPVEKTSILKVSPINVTKFTLETGDKYFSGENVTISVTLLGINDEGLNETFKVIVNNTEYNVTVVNGTGSFNVSGLGPGQYSALGIFDSNPNYNKAYASGIFYVTNKTILTIDDIGEVVYGEPILVTVHLTDNEGNNLSGTVLVNGVDEIQVKDGVGTYLIDIQPDVGEYEISASYDGDVNYYQSVSNVVKYEIIPIKISKDDVDVDIHGIAPDNVTVSIYGQDGVYNVTVEDKTVQITVVDSYGSEEIFGLTIGNKTFTIASGDDNYELEPFTKEFLYLRGAGFKVVADEELIKYEENANFTVTIDADATGNISIYDNDIYIGNVTVEEARNGIIIPMLVVGNHDIEFKYSGDANFNKDTYFVFTKVEKITPAIEVNVTENPKVGDTVTLNVSVSVYEEGILTINVDGKEIFKGETKNGGLASADVNFDLAAGEHTYIVTFEGTNNYLSNQTIGTFNVNKHDPTISIVVDNKDNLVAIASTKLTVTVGDATGFIIIEGLDGIIYEELENGVYALDIVLTADDYNLTVTYNGNDKYNNASNYLEFSVAKGSATPLISELTTPISTGDSLTFIVDMDSNSASGNVTVYVDGTPVQDVVLDSDYANASVTVEGLSNGTHIIGVKYNGNNNYNASDVVNQTVVVNVKAINPDDVKVEINNINEYPNGVNVTITSLVDGTYKVTVNGTVTDVEVVNSVGNATITVLNPGIYNATVTIDKEGYSLEAITTDYFEYLVTPEFNVVITGTYPNAEINITGTAGMYHVLIDGFGSFDIQHANSSVPTIFPIAGIDAGNYTAAVSFDAHDEYYGDLTNINFTINKAALTFEPTVIGDKLVGSPINITFTLPTDLNASNVFAFMDGVAVIDLNVNETTGVYTLVLDGFPEASGHLFVVEVNDPNYEEAREQVSFIIEKVVIPIENAINITVPVNTTAPIFSTNLPDDASGYLLVEINGKQYHAPVVNGTSNISIPPLAGGNYTANVIYTGDEKYEGFTNATNMTIESNVTIDNAFDIPAISETSSPAFTVELPNDATGFLIVDVGGKKYVAVVENGTASITVSGLSNGDHNVTVTYSGDNKYPEMSKNATINVHVPVFKITENKNLSPLYSAKSNYKVLITKDGKAVGAGESVTIKFNGKTYTVKTDANGYATLKLNTKVKVKKYTITASYNGVTVKNTVKVKQIIKAYNKKYGKKAKKTTKVKKSKYYKIKIYLKKVNGKYLKKAKIKIKFKGKTYKAKTNKKGKAIWKLKKTVVKKLKKGKKYKYRITYGKAVLTKTIVRR